MRPADTQRERCSRPAAEVAWALLRLTAIAEHCLAQGCCIGELRARDIVWQGRRVERVRSVSSLSRVELRHRRNRHLRRRHDPMCFYFGVPETSLRSLLESWGGEQCAIFLMDAVDEAVADLDARAWGAMSPQEVLEQVVGGRITVHPPTT